MVIVNGENVTFLNRSNVSDGDEDSCEGLVDSKDDTEKSYGKVYEQLVNVLADSKQRNSRCNLSVIGGCQYEGIFLKNTVIIELSLNNLKFS